MIKCPNCNVKVRCKLPIDNGNNEVYREGVCPECGRKYYTLEYAIEATDEFLEEFAGLKRELMQKYRDKYKRQYIESLRSK